RARSFDGRPACSKEPPIPAATAAWLRFEAAARRNAAEISGRFFISRGPLNSATNHPIAPLSSGESINSCLSKMFFYFK
ncbi:MAG: hypothetical protein R3322_13415, partial [Kiloniellales bacterium]|nr:hypothetical protein [Kiloniellales bacterium]